MVKEKMVNGEIREIVVEALFAGAITKREIVDYTGLDYAIVSSLVENGLREMLEQNRASADQMLVVKAKKLGINSHYLSGLARDLNIPRQRAEEIASLAKIHLVPRLKYTKSKVKEFAKEGLTDLEISRRLRIHRGRVQTMARKADVDIKIDEPTDIAYLDFDPKYVRRNIRILEGWALEAIAQDEGVTRQSISMYLDSQGLHKYWKNLRENKLQSEKIELHDARTQIVDLLANRTNKLLLERSWSEAKAFMYSSTRKAHKKTNLPYVELVQLLTNYKNAQESKVSATMVEISKNTKVSKPSAAIILRELGLPLFRTRATQHQRITQTQRATLTDLLSSLPDLSSKDLSYFAGRPLPTLSNLGLRNQRIRNGLKFFGKPICGSDSLNYRIASQVYEAQDTGFQASEIAELIEEPIKLVEYAMSERSNLQQKIMYALSKLYPDREINRPYLQSYDFAKNNLI